MEKGPKRILKFWEQYQWLYHTPPAIQCYCSGWWWWRGSLARPSNISNYPSPPRSPPVRPPAAASRPKTKHIEGIRGWNEFPVCVQAHPEGLEEEPLPLCSERCRWGSITWTRIWKMMDRWSEPFLSNNKHRGLLYLARAETCQEKVEPAKHL